MIGKLDDYMRFNETALSLRSTRQQVLASNIANADTPNYKARDIDFASALKGALARSGADNSAMAAAAPALRTTSPLHLSASLPGGATAQALADGTPLLYRTPAQGSVDANTVDMDVERNQFADNALRYETAVTLLNGQIKGMLTAIQGAQ
ncbi:flagellar basal body rod protein FlgB [Janthinobacterium agaricidamnosum]|uniref:Flagellar basal body rod protein FlgB n=1 Tax=Janthinobacterium agaricidamnosum NBRC 102515 = DSM 9628 TaxID=1349767 RepID=W0V2P3_9BURK|nr:flagellar basal body rod protein FlgB [Janthinobacterium agaricidamnosum]CDG81875.1 flagellar basal-body rod protein FlgB [Janthinobacterium agaricidamnosum NBRC 102515 = DSM 9628]